MPSGSTFAELHGVLGRFGLVADEIHGIRSGRVNKHWRAVAGDSTYALRRYNALRSPSAIGYEHALLAFLAKKQWPVAAPLPATDGETAVDFDGRHYSLFPFLEGRTAPYNSPYHLRIKGRLLARLHTTMAPWQPAGQRDGFGRLQDLDPYARSAGFATFAELVASFGHEHRELAEEIQTRREQSLDELLRLGFADLPAMPVHMDFHHDNIRFQRGELTALLDFDSAHLDARIADIAVSIDLDCREPPTFDRIDPRGAGAFLAGYVAEMELDERELRLIVPLLRAQVLWLIGYRLSQWATGAAPDSLRSITSWLTIRLPAIEERAAAIDAAAVQ